MDDYIYSVTAHKDFHIILNDLIKIVRNNFGDEFLKNFLKNRAKYIYKPLIKRIKNNGFIELNNHLKKIFTAEGGKFDLEYTDNRIDFKVCKCPALDHLSKNNIQIDNDFCLCSTSIINKAIAEECNYNFSLEYDLIKKSCKQIFWI